MACTNTIGHLQPSSQRISTISLFWARPNTTVNYNKFLMLSRHVGMRRTRCLKSLAEESNSPQLHWVQHSWQCYLPQAVNIATSATNQRLRVFPTTEVYQHLVYCLYTYLSGLCTVCALDPKVNIDLPGYTCACTWGSTFFYMEEHCSILELMRLFKISRRQSISTR